MTQPILFNPQEQSAKDYSPVSMLYPARITNYRQSLAQQNTKLTQYQQQIKDKLIQQKQTNAKLQQQAIKYNNKVIAWHRCFEESNDEYLKKIQQLNLMKLQLQELKNDGKKRQHYTYKHEMKKVSITIPHNQQKITGMNRHINTQKSLSATNQGSFAGNLRPFAAHQGLFASHQESVACHQGPFAAFHQGNRINSIAVIKKKPKKRQALSLTNLHKYNQ